MFVVYFVFKSFCLGLYVNVAAVRSIIRSFCVNICFWSIRLLHFFLGGGYEIQLNLMPHWTIRVFQIAQDVKCTAKRQIPIASLYAHMRIGPKINRKTFLRWGSSIAVQYRFALSVKCWGPFSTKRKSTMCCVTFWTEQLFVSSFI